VVVDSTINADVMEFYAAEDARGGVLEAAGAASIKYRDRDILATAHRIDHALVALDKQLAEARANASGNAAAIKDLERQIKARERMLFGVFQQVAVHFADLHDTPGRMKAKGVIKKQIAWGASRQFFYWRLRRRLLEFALAADISNGHTQTGAQTQSKTRIEVAGRI
jgi:acetyl-CoA carboxylase/biotin carboxylase 1